MVQQEALEVFYVVCHFNDDLIGDLAHNFPSIRIAHRNNGLVEALVEGENKAAAITLNLLVEIFNSLVKVFSPLLGIEQWLRLGNWLLGHSRYSRHVQLT